MTKLVLNLIILVLTTSLLGCESKKTYDIGSDKVVSDLSIRIKSLTEDLDTLTGELKDVKKVLEDPDIDSDLRASIRKEIHEGEKYEKEINQIIAYLKIRRKKRYNSLLERKDDESLAEEAEKEVRAYFVDKELHPIKRKWNERYRTAIEL